MKNIGIALFAALAIVSCSDNKKEGNLQLTGNIEGLKKGTIYIKQVQDTALVVLDSIKISGDSHFATTLNVESPEMLHLFLNRGTSNTIDDNLMFFAEPGKMNIETTLQTFYAKAKITGSKNHDLYEEYKTVKSRFTNQELEFTEQKLNAFKNKTEVSAADQEKYNNIVAKKYLYAINFALNHKDKEIAPYIALAEISDANIKFLDTIQKSMAPKVAASKYGKILTKFVAERKKEEKE